MSQSQTTQTFLYAVVQVGGKQLRVQPNQVLKVEKIEGAPGDVSILPGVGFKSEGSVLKQIALDVHVKIAKEPQKDEKVIVFKKRRRKGYVRTKGHRQLISEVVVDKLAAAA